MPEVLFPLWSVLSTRNLKGECCFCNESKLLELELKPLNQVMKFLIVLLWSGTLSLSLFFCIDSWVTKVYVQSARKGLSFDIAAAWPRKHIYYAVHCCFHAQSQDSIGNLNKCPACEVLSMKTSGCTSTWLSLPENCL